MFLTIFCVSYLWRADINLSQPITAHFICSGAKRASIDWFRRFLLLFFSICLFLATQRDLYGSRVEACGGGGGGGGDGGGGGVVGCVGSVGGGARGASGGGGTSMKTKWMKAFRTLTTASSSSSSSSSSGGAAASGGSAAGGLSSTPGGRDDDANGSAGHE